LSTSAKAASRLFFVSSTWLVANLDRVKVFDASWHMPAANKNAYNEYIQERIPGARFFDIDRIADTTTTLPHMLPSPHKFAQIMGEELGISDKDKIVVYDSRGMFSAPRAWYTCRLFGASDVHILDGGLPLWKYQKLPIESGPTSPFPATTFNAQFLSAGVVALPELLAHVRSKKKSQSSRPLIVDTRSNPRFFLANNPNPELGSD